MEKSCPLGDGENHGSEALGIGEDDILELGVATTMHLALTRLLDLGRFDDLGYRRRRSDIARRVAIRDLRVGRRLAVFGS